MFTCKKCGDPLFIKSAILKDKILKMETRCLRGHKSVRRLAEHQVQDMAEDLSKRLSVCLECGSVMMFQGSIDIEGPEIEGYFLCPNHGPQKREFPSHLTAPVTLLSAESEVTQSIMESFRCNHCNQVFAVSDIKQQQGYLDMRVQCPNGHKDIKHIPDGFDEEYFYVYETHIPRAFIKNTLINMFNEFDFTKMKVPYSPTSICYNLYASPNIVLSETCSA